MQIAVKYQSAGAPPPPGELDPELLELDEEELLLEDEELELLLDDELEDELEEPDEELLLELPGSVVTLIGEHLALTLPVAS